MCGRHEGHRVIRLPTLVDPAFEALTGRDERHQAITREEESRLNPKTFNLVHEKGLEPSRVAPPEPKACRKVQEAASN